jgi:hypothetical protein
MSKRIKIFREKNSVSVRATWRLIDGVIRDTFDRHQDYLTNKGRHAARLSLVKRLVPVLIKASASKCLKCRSRQEASADSRKG